MTSFDSLPIKPSPPKLLTIAGSDSSGGAGIQADLKTFSALGGYGASVITALTAQNTQGVWAVHAPDAAFVTAQLDAVFDDIAIDAVKIGMLANAPIIRAVAAALTRYKPVHIILDTVMLAKSGHALLAPDAMRALREELFPLSTLITPNLPEAAALLGAPVARNEEEMVQQGEALQALGAQNVLMKGGHLGTDVSPDWLIYTDSPLRFVEARLSQPNHHGTGCTLSAAIAALCPAHPTLTQAIGKAKTYLTEALLHSTRLQVGRGIGPVHHFYRWW